MTESASSQEEHRHGAERRRLPESPLAARFELASELKAERDVFTWLALDRRTGGPVVVRLISEELLAVPAREHIEREAALLRSTATSRLAPILLTGEDQGFFFLVRRYVRG